MALLKAQPYAASFPSLRDAPLGPTYRDALAGYAAWRETRNYGALSFAVGLLKELCATAPGIARLSTLARIAWEAGERDLAAKTLKNLRRRLKGGTGAVREPFWPAGPRGDALAPEAGTQGRWFLAQALAQEERLASFSSYWGRPAFNLKWLADQPGMATEMLRRHTLGALRADPHTAIPERLSREAPDHLNADAWRSGAVTVAARGGGE